MRIKSYNVTLDMDIVERLKKEYPDINLSEVLRRFLENYVVRERNVELITCNVCNKQYNSKLNLCPNCAEKEVDVVREQEIVVAKTKVVIEERVKLNEQRSSLEEELSRVNSLIIRYNDSSGTDIPDEERRARLQTFIEKATEIRRKILELEQPTTEGL